MPPRLNLASLILLVAATVLFQSLRSMDRPDATGLSYLGDGGIYGVALGWSWVASVLRHRVARVAARTMIVCLFTFLMCVLSKTDGNWLRYAIQLGSIIVTQIALFHVFKVPPWQSNLGRSQSETRIDSTVRFTILDVMLLTLVYGMLMALAQVYLPPISLAYYWPVAILLSIYFPVLAALVAHSSGGGKTRHRFMRSSLIFILVGAGAWGLAWIESRLFGLDADQMRAIFVLYLLLSVGFVVAVAFFAFSGVFGNLFRHSKLPEQP